MRKKLKTMSLQLNSDQFHAGLLEICRHFDGKHSDDYLNGMVEDLSKSNEMLFAAMHVEQVRRNIKNENAQLGESLTAAVSYITSFAFVGDEAVKASAVALLRQFASYGKPFSRMTVDERVSTVRALLRDLQQPALEEHQKPMADLPARIKRIGDTLETLELVLYENDRAKGTAEAVVPKMTLKREAAEKLEMLVDYLKAMSVKDAASYGKDYAVVTQIIARLNTRRRRKGLDIVVDLEDDEAIGDEQLPVSA